MMANQLTAYVWEEHHDKTKESWRQLFESNKFTDVTLVCGDQKTIEAHRLILSACSPVFAKILDQNTSAHPWIYLRGIDYEELKSIIEFIYLGASSLESSKVNEFFEIAADLEVSSITKSQESARRLFNKETTQEEDKTEKKDLSPLPPTLDEVNADSDEEMGQTESNSQEMSIVGDSFVDSYGVPVVDEEDNKPKFEMEPKSNRKTKSFNCNICSAKYASKGGVQLHIKLKHGQLDVLKEQDKNNGQKEDLNEVTTFDTKKPNISDFFIPNDTSCDECGYEAKNILDLKHHAKTSHEATRFKCNLCNFRAPEKSALKMHIMQVHIGKTFTCIRCNFSTKKKAQLKVHLKEAHPDISAINLNNKENVKGLNQLLKYNE